MDTRTEKAVLSIAAYPGAKWLNIATMEVINFYEKSRKINTFASQAKQAEK